MKNFLRALRHAWPYRGRLLASLLCALAAALLWGLNFTSIYPFLKLLHTGQGLHQWVDEAIVNTQKEVDKFQARRDGLDRQRDDLDKLPPTHDVEKKKLQLTSEVLRVEARLQSAHRQLYWYQLLRGYIYKFLPDDTFQALVRILGLVFVGMIIKCCFEFVHEVLVGSVVNRSLFDLRNRFFRNVIHLDVEQFNEAGTSELMARFTNDTESLGAGFKVLFGRVVAEPLRALACIALACFISWQLTLLFLFLVPVAAFILAKVARLMKRATRRVLERMSTIYKILQETFSGIRIVKAFTREAHERGRFREATRDYYHKAMTVVRIDALADPLIEIMAVAAVACALLAGSYLVLQKETHLFGLRMSATPMEPEGLLQLYILLAAIADPVRKLSSVLTRLQSATAASDRIFAFIDRRPNINPNSDGPRLERPPWLPRSGEVVGWFGGSVVDAPGAPPAGQPPNHPTTQPPSVPERPDYIEFRDICFSYEPGQPVLSNIHLRVAAGETLALVGPNGCGKTTLLNLLPRFFDPDHGTILIDGLDLRKCNLRSVRKQVAIVTQDPFLFDDTILANIAYGSPGATPAEVEEAAKRAYAHDFIVAFPEGYQKRVGERGALLAGGQRQRIALARAILRNPSILVLDEFTSQVDTESEAAIHRAVQEFKRGRTVFLITHRLHTLEIADRIVVLDAGHIAATGTHADLLVSCPLYQRLHDAVGSQRRVA